ncbi:MAG: hypothetical protein GY941_29260, partial [Planctomycetes bacterium]|nr:hypothetical protein [Planctomycetota bacterium]
MKKPCDTVELVAQMLENEFDAMPPTARDIASKLIQVVTCNDHGNGSIDEMK